MPTFFARLYMRRIEEVSSTEKVLGVFILLLLAGLVVLFAVQVATNEDYLFEVYVPAEGARGDGAGAQEPFPDPGVEEWRAPSKVSHFTPDNLYLKIDGRADAYLQFHVVGLTFGTYYHQTDGDRTVDVYWYDMGNPHNALGMYRSEAPHDAAKVAIGREGYRAGGAVFFWKGASYVQVLPTRLDQGDSHVSMRIAERLSGRIEDVE